MIARLRRWGELVTFSHTIFALPFAASAVVLALREPHVPLTPLRALAMLGCMVTARTSAMAFNRWADRDVDARNPRTKGRPVPSGRTSAGEALALALGSAGAFWALAATLGLWPTILAPLVIVVLLGYTFAKRFTWAAHAWLGLALAFAPGGAWIAAGARPNLGIVILMVGIVTWLFGFDVLYALQDEGFDREQGLRSAVVRLGERRAILLAKALHGITIPALALFGWGAGFGPWYFVGLCVAAGILVYEHRLVRPGDLSRLGAAFFTMNGVMSVTVFAFALLDRVVGRG